MAATTLSAQAEIDNTRLLFGIINLVEIYGDGALSAMLEIMKRMERDASYLPAPEDFKAIIAQGKAA